MYKSRHSEWGGKTLFSHGTKHSKLQRPNSLFSLEHLSIDPNGRLVIAKIKLGDDDFFPFMLQVIPNNKLCLNLCTDIDVSKKTRPEL